jgi:hypothetical protein
MKIKKENQLGLNFSNYIKEQFYRIHNEKFFAGLDPDFVKPYKEQWKWILSDDENKNLLFTQTALSIAESIKIDKFKASTLKTNCNKKYTFLLDDKHFYRTCIKDGEIFVMRVYTIGQSINYDTFKILPEKNQVVYPLNQSNYLQDESFCKFLKLLIFVEFSELKEELLNPKQSYGAKKGDKYLNESDSKVILVDSTWNKTIIRNEAFGVTGHFRLQALGKGRLDRKLIYVKEHIRKGIIKTSKKQKL